MASDGRVGLVRLSLSIVVSLCICWQQFNNCMLVLQACLRLKGENGIMRKKFQALQKDIEEQREQLGMQHEQQKELYTTIKGGSDLLLADKFLRKLSIYPSEQSVCTTRRLLVGCHPAGWGYSIAGTCVLFVVHLLRSLPGADSKTKSYCNLPAQLYWNDQI